MDFQPVRDTISLWANVPVPRATRPGEQFEMPPKPRRPHRIRLTLTLVLLGMLLITLAAAG